MSNLHLTSPTQTAEVEKSLEKPLSDIAGQDIDTPVSDKPSKHGRAKSAASKPKTDTILRTAKTIESPDSADVVLEADQTVSVALLQGTPSIPVEPGKNDDEALAVDQIPDDLMRAFEENYRSEINSKKRIILTASVVLFLLACSSMYFVKQKLDSLVLIKEQAMKAAEINPPLPATQSQAVRQEPATVGKTSVPSDLPAFIPREGHDKTYAVKNPGWESYAGKQFNFRVFSISGKLKALQILGISGNVIPDSLVKTVLTELAGRVDYQINSRKNVSGFLVLRGAVANKADVVFYREDTKLRGLVVSLR